MLAGTGNGKSIQQFEKCRTELIQQFAGLSILIFLGPLVEGQLGNAQSFLDALYPQATLEDVSISSFLR